MHRVSQTEGSNVIFRRVHRIRVAGRKVQRSVRPGRQSHTRDWNGFMLLVPLNYFLQGTSEKSRNFQGSQDLWSWIGRGMQ